MKQKLSLLLLLICTMFVWQAKGQTVISKPTIYTTVANGTQQLTNVSLTDTTTWFMWPNDSLQMELHIKKLTSYGKNNLKLARLYVEKAGGFIQLVDTSYINPDDSLIIFYQRFLNPNGKLYLNIITEVFCGTCGTDPPTVNMNFEPKTTSCGTITQPSCELVKDGSMEAFTSCSSVKITPFFGSLPTCYWQLPNVVYTPTLNPCAGTSDYFNVCGLTNIPGTSGPENSTNANQNFTSMCLPGVAPHSGSGYLGAFLYGPTYGGINRKEYREYIVNQLYSPMIAGKTYSISMYVRLSNMSKYAISNISMLLTNSVPMQNFQAPDFPLTISPFSGQFISTFNGNTIISDKTTWTLLSVVYTPTANCNYITIGNFNNSTITNKLDLDPFNNWAYSAILGHHRGAICTEHDDISYYYFDDVSVKPIELNAGPDKSICTGSTTVLTSSINCLPIGANVTYTWSPSATLTTPNSYSTSASPTVTTNYTLTATVTFTNGTAPINLTDYVTVTVTNSGSFSLTANASPNPICLYPGSTSTLTTNSGTNLSYTWTTGSTTYTVPSPVVSPSVTTSYTVTTINCGQTYSAAVTVTVNSAPSFTALPNPICEGSAVTVSTSSLTTINSLNFGDPSAVDNISNPHYYNTGGNYSVTINGTYISGNCITNTVIPITVITSQTLSLSYSLVPCTNNYIFTSSMGCGSSSIDYLFSIDNNSGNIYSSPTPTTNNSLPYTFTTAGIYSITVMSSFDSYSSINTITINVVPVSTPTINITATSSTICLGNSTTLTASGASTYTWSTGATTSSISVTPTVNTTYTVTGTNASGCSSTKSISINVVPNLTLTATASPTVICAGSSSTLSATGATSYTWSPGALTGSVVVVSPIVNTTYTLTGSNGACTNTKTLTVVVNPKPTVTITASTSTVCAGSTVTLTASGSGINSYTWSPCSTACNTNTLVYTAVAGSNTYSINVTGTNGCTNTAVKTITAVASPTLSVNYASICSGNSATLTASGASTYTWNPSALTGSVLVVSPTVTTNYTVTGANANGCTNTAISTVTVSSNPPAPFSIIAPLPVIANGTGTNSINLSTNITNTTGLTFNWYPGGASTPTTNFNISQPEIISLTVNNTICGGTTTQSICVNYVAQTCSNTTLPILNNYTLTSPTQIANGSYFVTGTLTLDWSWDNLAVSSLDNKNFLMSTGSKVVVTPTSKVKIGLTSFYSCGGMWEGIELQSNATDAAQINLGGPEARIEDAYKAISCNNPLSKIFIGTGVVFNKNYIDVDINFATNSGTSFGLFYASPIYYLSESSANSPGGNLKCSSYYTPIVKARSYAGIKTNNVGVLNYNTPCNPADYTIVKNKDYGFYFNNTNANVNNVNFNNAVGVAYSYAVNFVTKPAGVGIYSENSGYLNVKPATTPTVGTTTTFTNLGYGIITNNTYTVDIQNTNHTAAAQSYTQDPAWGSGSNAYVWGGYVMTAGYGLNGIFATNARDVLRINNNTISSNYYPVTANYTLAPTSTNTMSVAQNTITKGTNADTREGVTFNSAISFTPVANNMRIAANTFSNVNIGVKVTSTSLGLRVSTNTITLNPVIGNARGVYVLGSNTVTVDNNDIRGNLTSTNVATWNVNNVGVLCENSSGCKIKCNTVTTTGHGIEFRGVNTSSGDGFFNNTLKYPIRRGFVLMNGGIIGTQGSSAGASANQWITGTSAWPTPATADPNKTSVGGTLTGGSVSDAINSVLYVHNNANELPNDNYFTSPSIANNIYSTALGSLTITTAGNYATCPTTLTTLKVAQTGNNSSVERDADFVNYINTVLPSSNTDMSPQDKYMLKQYMFDDLAQNPSTNSTLINFVNQQQNLSVDVYHDIDSLLANGNVSAASTINVNASQSNDITQTQNAYNALYINGINTKADLDNLSAIADLCPQLYGNAVYQARALLQSITYVGKVYADSCDNSKVRKEIWLDDEPTSVSVADGVQAKLYPNPNNGSFTLAYDLKKHNAAEVYVYDVTGKVVFKTNVDNLENIKQINTSNLQSGIYFIQLLHDKNLLWTDKLIISK